MKSKCGKKKRTSKQSGISKEKVKRTKSNVDLHILWTPPEQPLGELIAGRCYVLKKLAKNGLWLCWDIQQKRNVTVKTVSEEGSEEEPKDHAVPSPSEAVEEKHVEDEGSSFLAQVKDTSKRDVTVKTVSEEGSKENAKEVILQGEEEPKDHVVPSPSEAVEDKHMKSKCGKRKRTSKQSGISKEKVKRTKSNVDLHILWTPPEQPLGELIAGRCYVLKKLAKNGLWLCWDIQQKRDVTVKTVSEERSEEDAKEGVFHGEEEPKEHVVPSPSDAVEDKNMEDEGSSYLAHVKDTLGEFVGITSKRDVDVEEDAKEGVLQGEEVPEDHAVPSPSKAVEEKHVEDEGSSFLAQVKDMIDEKRCTLSSDIEAHDEAKYCVFELGDMVNDRYYVLAKIWISIPCTVWLSWDLKEKQEVVLKISPGNMYQALGFRNELDMLHMVHSMNAKDSRKLMIIKSLDDFEFVRSNGHHFCIVMDAMYCDLSHLLETKGRLPLGLVKAIAKQFLEGLEYLHCCSIIHTDIKPANVVLSWGKDVQSLRIKIIDFGNACFVSDNLCDLIQTKSYRALEVLLGNNYDTSVDIWSTACLLFQLATGDILFNGVDCIEYTWHEDHLASIIELLGPIPMNILSRSEMAGDFFDQNGSLRNVTNLVPFSLHDLLMENYDFSPNDAKALTEFLQPMLEFEPTKRATATQCLQHPWLGEHKGKTNANELKEDVRGVEGGGGGEGEQLMEN